MLGRQHVGVANFGLPEAPAMTKAKEWSPIDRMLANKRGSLSAGPKSRVKSTLHELPPENRSSPTPPVQKVNAQVQTTSWTSLVSEVVAPERQRCTALQGEIKALRGLLKQKEQERHSDDDAEVQQMKRHWDQERADLEAQIAALLQEREVAVQRHDAERGQWQDVERELKSELEAARSAARHGREDMGCLRENLERSQNDVKDLQKQISALRTDHAAVVQERDRLLQQLEREQTEMMARVDAMEQRMLQRPK